jgi:hypothetical protein
MPVTYATYSEFTAVYSHKGISPAEINSYWLVHGALRVNESLGHIYTTPFSTNNYTAKDLSIQYAELGILVRTRKKDDSKELDKQIAIRVTDITSGSKYMMTDEGLALHPDGTTSQDAWSETMDYKPTFDMRDAMDQRVDPDRIDDEWDADA